MRSFIAAALVVAGSLVIPGCNSDEPQPAPQRKISGGMMEEDKMGGAAPVGVLAYTFAAAGKIVSNRSQGTATVGKFMARVSRPRSRTYIVSSYFERLASARRF